MYLKIMISVIAIFPIALSSSVFFVLNLMCIGAFAGYYTVYQRKPRPALVSIASY